MRIVPLIAFLFLTGCPTAPVGSNVPNSIPAVGTSVDKASSHVTSAEVDVQAALPLAPGAKIPLSLASQEHKLAQDELKSAKDQLANNEKEREQIIAQAAEEDRVSDAKIADRDKQLYALNHSWGHKVQVYSTLLFWIILALAAVHVAGVIGGLYLPQPYGTIAAIIGRVVNPFGWLLSILSHFQKKAAVATALSGAPASASVMSTVANAAANISPALGI